MRADKNRSSSLTKVYEYNDEPYVQITDFQDTACIERALGLTPKETYEILKKVSKNIQEFISESGCYKAYEEGKNTRYS